MLEHPVRTSALLDRHRQRRDRRRARDQRRVRARAHPAGSWIPPTRRGSPPPATRVRSSRRLPRTSTSATAKARSASSTASALAVKKCTIVHGTGPHILLIGDSHAWMLIPAFVAVAKEEGLTLSVTVRGGCPWQRGLVHLVQERPVQGDQGGSVPASDSGTAPRRDRRGEPRLRNRRPVPAPGERSARRACSDRGRGRSGDAGVDRGVESGRTQSSARRSDSPPERAQRCV